MIGWCNTFLGDFTVPLNFVVSVLAIVRLPLFTQSAFSVEIDNVMSN